MLTLEDLKDNDETGVFAHIAREYFDCNPYRDEEKPAICARADQLREKFEVLIAYESVGSWGCDSSSFFLLRERATGKLFENHGSHCSCYGFEDQWTPEETTLEYLKSDKFSFSTGGYCSGGQSHIETAKRWIAENL